MKPLVASILMLLAILSFAVGEEKIPNRDIDVGIFSDVNNPQRTYEKRIPEFRNKLMAYGLKVESVDEDIFLPGNKDKRDKHKRILILYYYTFPEDICSGMNDYVRSGGLLISNANISPYNNKARKVKISIHGIYASSSVRLKDICSLIECPLTRGLEKGKNIECQLWTRKSQDSGAEILVSGSAVAGKDKEDKEIIINKMPVVAFKHSGNGAFIYLGIPDNEQLLKNCFSDETLDWLTSN